MTENYSYRDFFPYSSAREGQIEMMETIEECVRTARHVCAEAPNGFGKTCVTLAGVLPWVKENEGKVLYCARTHKQLDRVMEELAEIATKTGASGVSFRGRQHMCINDFVTENAGTVAPLSEVCGHLKAERRCPYYENLRPYRGTGDLLADFDKSVLTATEIVQFGREEELCPYELAKLLAKEVDVVALSYLYVFDPHILERFAPELEIPLSKVVLVEDEAHNVPHTALDSASDALTLRTIRQAINEGGTYNDDSSKRFCRGLARVLLDLSSDMSDNSEMVIQPDDVMGRVKREADLRDLTEVLVHMVELGLSIKRGLVRVGKYPVSAIHRVAEFTIRFRQVSSREDFAFLVSSSITPRGSKRVALEIVALDPTSVTAPIVRRVHSVVAVSGTMSPLWAYAEMMGLNADTRTFAVRNPFSRTSRIALVVDGLDTSYAERTRALFERMVNHCVAVAHSTPGNTGIFTTSYKVLRELLAAGLGKRLKKKLYVEKQGAKNTENDRLVEQFRESSTQGGAVLLGVQGGRNSEGGDFPGDTMNSVVVVGVPYARPTPRIGALIEYYDARFNGRGRDYAYVLPAMTRAIQAAGRPVRRLEDRGAIVFLDQRFATPYLRRFLPAWLSEVLEVVPDDPSTVAERVHSFFAG